MRKSELIKQLEAIKGNPEIHIWNGVVGDFMPIEKIGLSLLVKESEEHFLRSLKNEWCIENRTWDVPTSILEKIKNIAKAHHKKETWQIPNEFVYEEDLDDWYGRHQKTIIYLNPKVLGRTYEDRAGKIKY